MSPSPRSYLFVPGDAPDKMAKAAAGPADALILDLEDSVAPARKDGALETVCAFLSEQAGAARPRLYVRLNGTDPDRALKELAALPLRAIAGLVWPKLASVRQLDPIAYGLDALEARDGLPKGGVGIIGIVTETAASLLNGADLGRGHPRLQGYTWGMEDLSADIGRAPLPGASDAGAALAEHARLFCLLVARAAGIDAIDAVDPDFRTPDRLAAETARARELGFTARMAIHPAQIAPIHQGLAPDEATLSWARRVLDLAAAHPDLSAFQLDGRMVDRPHIRTAGLILERSRTP